MLSTIIGVLAPQTCLGCGSEGLALCCNCAQKQAYGQQVCLACGRVTAEGEACERCRAAWSLDGVAVGAHYDQSLKELVLAMKFHRVRDGFDEAVRLMAAVAPRREFDVVTCVPIAPARYRERGYNQSEMLAKRVARKLGLPYRALMGRETVGHQLGHGRQERLAQVKGAFYATRRVPKRVLVVDDVITTGATLNECAAVLRLAGAEAVWGLALARH